MSSKDLVTKVTLEVLRQPRLKAERADKHINELMAASQALPRTLYDLRVEARTIPPHAKPTNFQLRYQPLKPIAETFALMIGDAIYNLRAALDYLASSIVRTMDSK